MIVAEANRIASIQEYFFSRKLAEIEKLKLSGVDVINAGIGNPDMDPPAQVIEKLVEIAQNPGVNGYQSYKGTQLLRDAIAAYYDRIYDVKLDPNTEILPLLGSKEGIMHISQAFVNPGESVLIPNPGYPTYEAVSKITGASILKYDVLESGQEMLRQMEKIAVSDTKIIWINFPHMPTGLAPDIEVLTELVRLAKRRNILIVNDNPYSTILTKKYFSIFQIDGAKEVCLELNSLSKSHNMAGWRMGWVSGKKELIDTVLKVKSNMDSGMYLPIQHAAAIALSLDKKWMVDLNERYKIRQEKAFEIMDLLGATYHKNQSGLFVWAQIPAVYNSAESMSDEILNKTGVFITPGSIFGENGNRFIRISLCLNPAILDKIKDRIKNLKREK